MYDTINATWHVTEGTGFDYLDGMRPSLIEEEEHSSKGTLKSVTGFLLNPRNRSGHYLKVRVTPKRVYVGKASFSKWYYGDAYRIFTRADVEDAIGLLCELLKLPMGEASITRMDFGFNLRMRHPPGCYIERLGELSSDTRQSYPYEGVNYKAANRETTLYDKNKEQRAKRQAIPMAYKNANLLRIELRYKGRLKEKLQKERVTLDMLYGKQFWEECLDRLVTTYNEISKPHDITIDFSIIKGKRQQHMAGVATMIEKHGGLTAYLGMIKNGQRTGELTIKQAYDLKQDAISAWNSPEFSKPNELIIELNQKFGEAVDAIRQGVFPAF